MVERMIGEKEMKKMKIRTRKKMKELAMQDEDKLELLGGQPNPHMKFEEENGIPRGYQKDQAETKHVSVKLNEVA